MSIGKMAEIDGKMKDGRTRNSTGSCGLTEICIDKRHCPPPFESLRLERETEREEEKERTELTLFIISLSPPQTFFKRSNRKFQPAKRDVSVA